MGLLLKGGDVLDPGGGLTGKLDVRVRDGLVAEVASGLAADGDGVLDVSGKLVLPGLIDLHAHCFVGSSDFGPRTDDIARSTGVTTWVDGGSTGAGTFEGMREWVLHLGHRPHVPQDRRAESPRLRRRGRRDRRRQGSP